MKSIPLKRPKELGRRKRHKIVAAYRSSIKRLFLLDYDGTLVPFASSPALAKPGPGLIDCLSQLGEDSRNTLAIISGRDKQTLENWLGKLPASLNAEHGAYVRTRQGWKIQSKQTAGWMKNLLPVMESAKARLPGAEIEKKATALVFHYRQAAGADKLATETSRLIDTALPLAGRLNLIIRHDTREMVVEIKPADTNKALVVARLLKAGDYDFVFCAGDSTSDEEMFAALPPDAISVKVGPEPTTARYRLTNPADLAGLLNDLVRV